MRAVIQRASQASVAVGGETRGVIGAGLVILLGIEPTDTAEDSAWLANKVVQLRIFDDEQGLLNMSISEVSGGILLVSQFTLFASTKKGNRPSYSRAAPPEIAIPVYNDFMSRLTQALGRPIQTGEFGADMAVSLINDGPVTIIIDTKTRE